MLLQICPANVEVSRGALGPTGRAPRRYGLPFLSEKIITPERNGKTCNEARMSYGCGPEGSRSDFQGIPSEMLVNLLRNPLKPRSRYEWLSCEARNLGRIADWSERPTRRLRDRFHRLLAGFMVIYH